VSTQPEPVDTVDETLDEVTVLEVTFEPTVEDVCAEVLAFEVTELVAPLPPEPPRFWKPGFNPSPPQAISNVAQRKTVKRIALTITAELERDDPQLSTKGLAVRRRIFRPSC
jgi:hypothetical protein